ncbi:MAG: hypothetical protein PHI59_08605 [Candidatus Omnitrophica bacterium]|nr:hypothetical protein [Candidatus Omnitrophota bacterium]
MVKRPAWVKVVGVAGIIWGCLGILGAALTALLPILMPKILIEIQRSVTAGQGPQSAGKFLKMMALIWDTPYLRNSCLILGSIGIFVSGFLVFASKRLLEMKRSAIKLIYAALGIEIIVNILLLPNGVIFRTISILFGVAIYVVLLLVVAAGDKEVFSPRPKGE